MKRQLLSVAVMLLITTIPLSSQGLYQSGTVIDWERGHFIRATGFATADVSKSVNMVQAQLMAKRGAEVEARGELARTLEGVKIAGGATTKDMAAENEKVAEAFTAFLKSVIVVSSEAFMDQGAPVGKAIVELALNGNVGVLGRMYSSDPSILEREPAPSFRVETVAEGSKSEGEDMAGFDGLILDARNLSVRPDFNIIVKSPQGTVAYSRNSLDTAVRITDLTAGFCKGDERALEILKGKGSRNPLRITPQSLENGREFIVSSDDAMKIFSLHEKSETLKKARVIVITG